MTTDRLLPWLRAAATRLMSFVLTLLGTVVVVQLLLALAPGDAIDLLPNGDVLRAGLEAEWGLDLPLPQRLASTVTKVLGGDLGTSLTYRPGKPVIEIVAASGAQSLALVALSLVLGVALALALGFVTAGRHTPGSAVWTLRRAVQVVSVVPAFLAAFLVVMVVNAATWALIQRGSIARPDWFALPDTPSLLRTALAVTVLAIAGGALTEMHAACDSEIQRLRNATFVEAARARGAATWPHVLSNLVPPLVTLAATRTATLLGSLVIVEKVLLFNGAGATLWQACRMRDFPVAIGITLAGAAVVCGARLAADLVRITVDPRLRSEG